MKLHEVARIVVDTIARVAPDYHLTRIMVSEDRLNTVVAPGWWAPGWWRVAIGNGTIGVTEILSPDRVADAADMQLFIERLIARLDHALADAVAAREMRLDSAAE